MATEPGGTVTGPGAPTSDSVPARLSDGCVYVTPELLDHAGVELLPQLGDVLPENVHAVTHPHHNGRS